jgi:hypothetical protein
MKPWCRRRARLAPGLIPPLLCLLPLSGWGAEDPRQRFVGHYQELQEDARRGPFGLPLHLHAEEREDLVRAEVHGILDLPFRRVGPKLAEPSSWCEFIPLNLNIKACTLQVLAPETILTLYIGGKGYQLPEAAWRQEYRFQVRARQRGYVAIFLEALEGLLGTKGQRLEIEMASVLGSTVVEFRSSYQPSAASRLLTAIYLATLGRDKIGFSRESSGGGPPGYVKGEQGLIERNTMRYYLLLEAFLDTQGLPGSQRFEARLNAAYDLMERFPAQLHEMEKAEYLDTKRREHENQVRLQERLGLPGRLVGGP